MSRTIPYLSYDDMAKLASNFLAGKGRAAEPPVEIDLLMEKAGLSIVPMEGLSQIEIPGLYVPPGLRYRE